MLQAPGLRHDHLPPILLSIDKERYRGWKKKTNDEILTAHRPASLSAVDLPERRSWLSDTYAAVLDLTKTRHNFIFIPAYLTVCTVDISWPIKKKTSTHRAGVVFRYKKVRARNEATKSRLVPVFPFCVYGPGRHRRKYIVHTSQPWRANA